MLVFLHAFGIANADGTQILLTTISGLMGLVYTADKGKKAFDNKNNGNGSFDEFDKIE